MSTGMIMQLAPLVLLIFVMYFLLIRPQKKREKAVNEMRSNIHVGDEIITIGGICGKVVKVKDETLVIQVGADKLKFEVMRWSVSKVVNSVAKPEMKKEEEAQEEAPKKVIPKRMKKASDDSNGATVPVVLEKTEAPVEAQEEDTEEVK